MDEAVPEPVPGEDPDRLRGALVAEIEHLVARIRELTAQIDGRHLAVSRRG
jgi:hypothetical protein